MYHTDSTKLTKHTNAAAPTVSVLIGMIEADKTIPKLKRSDICSGVRSICRALCLSLHDTLAEPAFFRERLHDLTPAGAGMSALRLRNCKSHLDWALIYAGKLGQRKRTRGNIHPAYAKLLERVPDDWKRKRFTRFCRFVTDKKIPPHCVTTETFEQFRQALGASTVKDFHAVDRAARMIWNEMSEADPGWPKGLVEIPSYVDHYVLPAEAFPKSLWDDVEDYLTSRQKSQMDIDDLLADLDLLAELASEERAAAPVKPSTANLIRYRARQFASALVIQGAAEASSLTSLKEMVAVETVAKGLKFFIARNDGKARNSQIYGIACDLYMIARLWTGSDASDLAKLKTLCNKLKPLHEGLPESARKSLAPLADAANVRAFLRLSDQVFAKAGKEKLPDRALANVVATALWIRIAQRAPLRISNLLGIDIEQNLLRSQSGKGAAMSLFFPAEQVKNSKTLELPVPKATAKVVELYLKQYRPLLSDVPNNWLFPASNGGHKRAGVMASDIKKLMRKEVGFSINPHSFRHVAAKLYLAAHPGRHSDVQLLLGHKKLETTMKYYCDLDAAEVFKHFDKVLLQLEGEGKDGEIA